MSNPTPQQPNRGADAARDAQAGAGSSDESAPQRKIWRVGTLTYTTGSLVTLFSWLLWGDFAVSMSDRSVGPVVQLLLKRFGASDKVMALLLGSLPAALGVIFGPIISYRSDRHRGRWGRRIPYILVSTPIAALSMVGLAFSKPIADLIHYILGAHSPGGANLTLIIFGMFLTSFSFAGVITGAVFGALTNDVVPKGFLGRFYGLFRILSLFAGIVFNYWLIGSSETHSQWLFVGIAVLYGVGVVMMCMMVKEGEYPPPPDVRPGERRGFFAAAKVYLKECFSKPYYLWVFMAMTVASLCFLPVNLYQVPFCQSLGMSMERFGKYVALTYTISLCLAYFLGALVDRFHPLRVGILVLVLYAIATLWGGIYATTPELFGIALVAHGVISGTYFTTTAALPQRLFPDSTFAQFASAAGLLTAIACMGLSPIFGVALDLSGHQYRYTFLMSSGLTVLAVILMLAVHARFMRLGGPERYVAPE